LIRGYPLDGTFSTLASRPQSLIHDFFLDKLVSSLAIAVQPNGQRLLNFTTAQPDNCFRAFIHETPREQFAFDLSFALLEEWILLHH